MSQPEDRQSPEGKDPIEMQLREQNRYINDDGFTARVIAALPRRRRFGWFRSALLLGAAAIGWVLAVLWLPWRSLPPVDLSALRSLDPQVLTPWAMVLTVMVSVVWAMVAAVQWED
jgi:hypothetical protein